MPINTNQKPCIDHAMPIIVDQLTLRSIEKIGIVIYIVIIPEILIEH